MEGQSEDSTDSYSCSSFKSLKDRLAVIFMKELHKGFFNEIAEGAFMKPARRVESNPKVGRTPGGSTTDSLEDSGRSAKHPGGNVEEWKLNLITSLLLSFEERCITEKMLSPETVRTFRSMNRGLLGKVLESMHYFRNQKYTSIASCILMLNASKLKIPKEDFTKILTSIDVMKTMNLTSIHAIKRSKAFGLLQQVIKC